MAAMAFLLRARIAEKAVEGAGEKLIRDPDVLRRGRLERLYCSAADNGRSAHQACCCSWNVHMALRLELAQFGCKACH